MPMPVSKGWFRLLLASLEVNEVLQWIPPYARYF
ncbi:hypothetical protein C5167_023563, partial [Papaver somniferum]